MAATPPIVALIGIDGSGKSTQARRLAAWLTTQGYPAEYRQNASGRHWFGQLAHRLGRRDALDLLGPRLLMAVETVLRWLAIARSLRRARRTGTIAVMDRYGYCQDASVRAHRGRPSRLVRALFRVFPTPTVTLWLALPPGEALRRVEVRGTDREEPGYLAAFDAGYRALPEAPGFIMVDAAGTPDEVQRAVRHHTLDVLTFHERQDLRPAREARGSQHPGRRVAGRDDGPPDRHRGQRHEADHEERDQRDDGYPVAAGLLVGQAEQQRPKPTGTFVGNLIDTEVFSLFSLWN
jgi:dTMP kinase